MRRIYLIGGRASGKTTIGRELARRAKLGFIDLDELLCDDMGKSVAEIVALCGWDGFRDNESRILRMAGDGNYGVIACGGGIVERAENLDYMRKNGFVAWLCPDISVMAKRLAANPLADQRPSLTGGDILAEIAEVMERRKPLYESASHAKIDSARALPDVCEEIMRLYYDKMGE